MNRNKMGLLLLILLSCRLMCSCIPLTPSPYIAIEQRGATTILLSFRCGGAEYVERLQLGQVSNLDGPFQTRLEIEDNGTDKQYFEFEITGLAPPSQSRRSSVIYPLHTKIDWNTGSEVSTFGRSPKDGMVRFHTSQDLIEIEGTLDEFHDSALHACSESQF